MKPSHYPTHIFMLAFLAANLFLSSFYVDIWCTPNAVSRALPVLTLLENGSPAIDKYVRRTGDKSRVGDHYFSDKAPLPTLLAVPFYRLVQAVGLDKTDIRTGKKFPIHIWKPLGIKDGRLSVYPDMIPLLFMCSLLFGSLPFAAMIFITAKKALAVSCKPFTIALVMVSFYGSFLFVFAGTFFNHIFAAFLLLLGYIHVKDRAYFRSGLFTGLSFLSEYTVCIALPLWLIIIAFREKSLKQGSLFVFGALPSIMIFVLYNLVTTGQPLTTLYAYNIIEAFSGHQQSYGFALPSLQAIWGLSFSLYLGLMPHVPVLLFGVYFLFRELFLHSFYKKLLLNYLTVFSFVFFLFISSFFVWWGGWTYGPRYLIVLAALLLYENTIFLTDKKINLCVFWIIGLLGIIGTWLAKVTVMYMLPDQSTRMNAAPGTSAGKLYILHEFFNNHFNSNNILSLGFNVEPAYAAYLWLIAFIFITFFFTFWCGKINLK